MILDKIVEATKKHIKHRKEQISLEEIRERALSMPVSGDFPFERALKELDFNFICEVKKASPSKGILVEDFPYIQIAKDYEMAGAAAISVLTEPDFFLGSPQYLQDIAKAVTIPVLRKDFIIDDYQIYEAKVWGASAILLICSILDDKQLKEFHKLADSLGLSCLVEAHDAEEVQRAIQCGARIIGVNNRNLKDFTVDIQNSIRLRQLVDDHIIFVSESGLDTPEHIQTLRNHNIHAALMGESFMKASNKIEKLAYLYGKMDDVEYPHIKFCGIQTDHVLPTFGDMDVDYVGFVFAPSKREVTIETARRLRLQIEGIRKSSSRGPIHVVGVFVNATIQSILHHVREVPLDVIQLHGDEDEVYVQELRQAIHDLGLAYTVEIWKALAVKDETTLHQGYASVVDRMVFDTFSKADRGGTGQSFDWSLLDSCKTSYILAGGLGPHNVARAIRKLRPWGIDMSSGIEVEGRKDAQAMQSVIHIVNTICHTK